jgi:hypothetical protein
LLKYTWSQTRPDLRYSEINSKVESPVRVAIRNRGSERAIGKSGPEGKQVFYLRTKQKSRHRALGDSKRTWSDGKTTPVARCCEVSRNPRTYRARRYVKTVAVNPAYTSQQCSNCGATVKKSLSMRAHACGCGFVLDRDSNAAINILKLALSTVGHTGTWVKDPNASGDSTSTLVGSIQSPASWVYERRIPSPLGMGVSNECYSATSASASASGASGTSCLIVK